MERLLELHLDQPALAPELPDVGRDLIGDPDRVLEGADSADDLPQRHCPIVLVHGEAPRLLPEPPGELLERRDGRVGLREGDPDVLEDVRPVDALVQAHHPPPLGDRDDEAPRLLRGSVGCYVAHPRLVGLQARVGAELDVGVVDNGHVGGDQDRAVHLRQLVEAHRRELEPDLHPPGDDSKAFEPLWVGHDYERAVVRPHHVLYGLPEIRAWGYQLQGPRQLRR